MIKNTYLSRMEQSLFDIIRESNVNIISNEQIKDLMPNKNINKLCSSLMKKGYFHKIKRGIYIIQFTPSKRPIIADPYLIALNTYRGYLGFSTALKMHGLIEYEPFTIFLITNYKSKTLHLGQYIFKIINMHEKAKYTIRMEDYTTSTLEKTFFDCFFKPEFAGGYQNIAKALYNTKLNWGLFIKIFNEFASSSLCQRTGYILELIKNETGYKIDSKTINYMKKRIKNNTKLIPKANSKGIFIKKWKLIDNLGKDKIMGWYNG